MYKVKDEVTIIKTGEVKQIIDFETVCGVEVYYMSDKTSYPVDEIITLNDEKLIEFREGLNDGRIDDENICDLMEMFNKEFEKELDKEFGYFEQGSENLGKNLDKGFDFEIDFNPFIRGVFAVGTMALFIYIICGG